MSQESRLPTAEEVRRFNRALWVPVWFTAFLCLIALGASILSGGGAASPAFYCFLPMAFFFSASVHRGLSERIARLEARLGEASEAAAG